MNASTNTRRFRLLTVLLGSAVMIGTAAPVLAQDNTPIAVRSSFRVGTSGVLCTAQYRSSDPMLSDMFDRAYRVVCRDASSPVGSLYALRNSANDRLESFLTGVAGRLTCAPRVSSDVDGIGETITIECRDEAARVDYRIYAKQKGDTLYIAQGLSGYDSALRLGLASIVTDRQVAGPIDVATTSVSDPAAFARVQAGALDENAARNEAYIRNNYGAYAESAEFFETLASREGANSLRSAEFVANQALQQSNMGDFVEAKALFDRATRLVAASDGVGQRMIRNYRTIDRLNAGDAQGALQALDAPVVPVSDNSGITDMASGLVTQALADRINREDSGLRQLGGADSQLTPFERSRILDGQAELLRGMALRLNGQLDPAIAALTAGAGTIGSVREGRIASTAWLLSDVATQKGLIFEQQGKMNAARASLEEALAIFESDYPQSPAVLGARARLAAFLARRGEADASIALYDQVVTEADNIPGAKVAMKDILGPYFAQLSDRANGDRAVAAKMFAASQLLQRPGVAQTQAVLARELSEGNDEASALFRLTVTRTREIARTSAEIEALAALPAPTSTQQGQLAALRSSLEALQNEQTALQSRLGQYSQYRVLSPTTVGLEELQSQLRPGEGYYKISLVGEQIYGQLITREKVGTVEVGMTRTQLDAMVAALRDSIVVFENGQPVNYPFDVERSRALYKALFTGLEADLVGIEHLVYEPDGALLQLPPGLFIQEQAGVDAYLERTLAPDADPFDFTEIAWFGRDRRFSIAVSPRSFVDVRAIAPARGKQAYLGLGQNAFPPPRVELASSQRSDDCEWPLSTWRDPITPAELFIAQKVFGQSRSTVLTGESFSDQALLNRDDLDQYRILHFATHGLVTAPRPECPARPALVTSFGQGSGSDGLLSFREIFDFKLDADLVILSACDTAGLATVSASREAGIETGGNFALDGLVRAFVGAGARSVLASHWPVPDDFNATEQLISTLFEADEGTAVNASLAKAQRQQMDDPLTSHPYYWAAFILLGDGTKPLVK